MRRIHLMHDWRCWPLWEAGGDPYNIDPSTLPISGILQDALGRWQQQYDSHLNPDDPNAERTDQPPGTRTTAELDRQAIDLWLALRDELEDHDVDVGYQRGGTLVWTPEQVPETWRAARVDHDRS